MHHRTPLPIHLDPALWTQRSESPLMRLTKCASVGIALNLFGAERLLWVQFQEGPSHVGTTDYTIRMNYTTIPRTWVPVNKWKHHLSVHYKEYYSSGFLSIQVRLGVWHRDQ